MGWLEKTLVGFDTETTGVDARNDRIVTAAIISRAGPDGPLERRTWLINPGVEIPASATAIHGITNDRVRAEGVPPTAALDEIARSLTDALREGFPIVGFNVAFDLGILEAELARHGLPTLVTRTGVSSPSGIGPLVDPLVLDRLLDRYRKGKRKLIDLCAVYSVRVNGNDLHAADADVIATLDLIHAMAHAYPSLSGVTLPDLHDQQVAAYRTWAQHFRAYLTSKGRTDDLPETDWPLPSSWPTAAEPAEASKLW
jgi:DNA polymerase-3 subunit epsilon